MNRHMNMHFIGIGGIGMSGVARICKSLGHNVTGSDVKDSPLIRAMREEGIACFIGHDRSNLGEAQRVVYSTSIDKHNVELISARQRGLEIMHRSQILSEITEGKNCVAITGAHGKTTTTALIALIFREAGRRPLAAVGGEVLNFQSNVLCGSGPDFILEADESDGSFLHYRTDRAVILNIDREHMDYFKEFKNVITAYKKFLGNIKESGRVYYNSDEAILKDLCSDYDRAKTSFSIDETGDLQAIDIRHSGIDMVFRLKLKDKLIDGEFSFSLPGRHNVKNALAAIAVSLDEGINIETIRRALREYRGTKRRFEIKETLNDFMLVEDYAHHPTEIEAVIKASKSIAKNLIVVFQPHRYTRTKDLFENFTECFKMSKHLILTDIYAASEKEIDGVSSKKLFDSMKFKGMKNVEYISKDKIPDRIKDIARKDDMVLVLGAGDINEITEKLIKR